MHFTTTKMIGVRKTVDRMVLQETKARITTTQQLRFWVYTKRTESRNTKGCHIPMFTVGGGSKPSVPHR
jgi:hypothetical protein